MSEQFHNDVIQFLRRTIANLIEDPGFEHTLDDDQLLQGAGMDSIRIMNLLVRIETEYEIMFDDDELLLENFESIRVIADRILQKVGIRL
jgi:acyl carrier protein